jgi:hypothetical protein
MSTAELESAVGGMARGAAGPPRALRRRAGRQWQPAQLERTQLPQLEPPDPPEEPPELLDDPPIANVEKAFRHFLHPQSGQDGFLSRFERTKTSKRLPQRSQSYSKIGIRRPLSTGR